MFHFLLIASTVVSAVLLGGCGDTIQQAGLNTTAKIMWRARGSMMEEPDLELARAAMPAAIKTAESFYIANPDNRKMQWIVTASYCGYAGFIQDDWEVAVAARQFDEANALAKRGTKLFVRCMNYGLQLLGPKWKRTIFTTQEDVDKLLKKERDVDGLYWTAMALGGVINFDMGDMAAVAHLGKVEAMLLRIIEIDEGHEYAMAHVLYGSIKCGMTEALGGTPEVGKKHFERAIELTEGKYLMAKVLYAKQCAVATQDRELFRTLLVDVLRTSPAVLPKMRLANELAHHKARRYLAQESSFF